MDKQMRTSLPTSRGLVVHTLADRRAPSCSHSPARLQPRRPTDTNRPPPHGRRKSPTRKRCLCLRLPSVRRNQSRRPPLRRHLPLPHLSTRPFDPPPSPLPPPAGPCPRFSALPRTQPPPTPRRPESSCLPARRGPAWCPPRRREGLRALVVCIGGIGR
jgi:hypothetical protein